MIYNRVYKQTRKLKNTTLYNFLAWELYFSCSFSYKRQPLNFKIFL